MKILSIETSCDETAVAIVEATGSLDKPKFEVLAKAVNSQIDLHKKFGGVFPSLAKREHARNIVPVLKTVLKSFPPVTPAQAGVQAFIKNESKIKKILEREPGLFEVTKEFLLDSRLRGNDGPSGGFDIDMIAVTSGPGLEPALWVGINFAKALSIAWQIPVLGVNHMEGHLASVLLSKKIEARSMKSETPLRQGYAGQANSKLEIRNTKQKIEFPALALLISGGHTELVEIENWNKYKILGKTRDDAVGESYDKVARLLGFPYPGGPQISAMAQKFRNSKSQIPNPKDIKFPRPMINSGDLDFSFSGLKTSVLYKTKELGILDDKTKQIIAGEFEQAVVDVLIAKLGQALNFNEYKNIIVAGGVVANEYIRANISDLAKNYGINALFPDLADSTDNAQMIACAGYFKSFETKPEINADIKADGNLSY